MNNFDPQRLTLFFTALCFVAFAMILPMVRMRIQNGHFGLAALEHRNWKQFLVGAGLTVSTFGLVLWTVAYAAVDPRSLGIWDVPVWLSPIGWALIAAGFAAVVISQAQM